MKKYVIVVFCVFFVLIGFFTFAQTPFGKSKEYVSPEEFKIKTVTQNKAEEIKKNYFDFLYSAQAVRNNDLSFCNKAEESQECKLDAQWLMKVRALAEGNCNEVGEDFSSQICWAIKNNCTTVEGAEKDVCLGFFNRDIDLLYQAGRKVLGYSQEEEGKEDALWDLNFYYGFKYYSVSACNRFSEDDYLASVGCKVLFGNKESQEVIDQIALDLAYLQYVKQNKNKSLCERIKNSFLKQRCKENYKIKDLLYN